MGFSLKSVFRAPKKIFKAAKKVVKSPLFPVIAGIAGPAMLAKYGASGALGSGVFQTGNALGSMGARAALSNAIAQAASGEDIDAKQIALQGIVSQLGAMGSAERDSLMRVGAEGIEGVNLNYPNLGETPSMLTQAKNLGIRAAGAVGDYIAPQEFKGMVDGDLVGSLKNIGSNVGSVAAATAINPATAEIMVDLNQQSIDDYNNSLLSSGMKDSGERRQAIFDYFIKNGYEQDRVNVMLDKYGYASGGITTLKRGLVDQAGSYSGRGSEHPSKPIIDSMFLKTYGKDKSEKKDDEDLTDKEKRTKATRAGKKSYDLTGSLQIAADAVETAFGRPLEMEPVEFKRFAQGGDVGEYKDIPNIFNHSDDGGIMNKISESMERDYDYFTRIKMRENLKQGETMEDAADLSEQEAMDMVMNKYTKGGFARGGEVEIEEQTDDLGIMDLMRDQGVEYGEQVSNAQNDELLEKLFEEFIDLGFSPEDAARKAREAFDDMSQGQGIEGTQVASGYRDPMLVEMYQQYVFEQEELGVRPMSFEDFKARATSGMADGGRAGYRKGGAIMKLVNMGMDPSMALSLYEDWKDSGSSLSFEDYVGYGTVDNYKDGGSVHHARRMAGGGASYNSSSRYSFLIDKYNKGIPLSPSEAEELEMLEMTYADQSRNLDMADGGIMNRNLLNTGMDKDMRGGGFIPEGTKEKADDVPARLSKNEFVMTADAVRAAGGGSVNKGAKRMYDAMHQLEAKV